jgi:hypothetical protein
MNATFVSDLTPCPFPAREGENIPPLAGEGPRDRLEMSA